MNARKILAISLMTVATMNVAAEAGFKDIFGGIKDAAVGTVCGTARSVKGLALLPVEGVKFAYTHKKATLITAAAVVGVSYYFYTHPSELEAVVGLVKSASGMVSGKVQEIQGKAYEMVAPYATKAMGGYTQVSEMVSKGLSQVPGYVLGGLERMDTAIKAGQVRGNEVVSQISDFVSTNATRVGSVLQTGKEAIVSGMSTAAAAGIQAKDVAVDLGTTVVNNHVFQATTAGVASSQISDHLRNRGKAQ